MARVMTMRTRAIDEKRQHFWLAVRLRFSSLVGDSMISIHSLSITMDVSGLIYGEGRAKRKRDGGKERKAKAKAQDLGSYLSTKGEGTTARARALLHFRSPSRRHISKIP